LPFDVEALLYPITDADPCGENLVYDAAFLELDQAFKGPPSQGMVGEAEVEEPDWREVRRMALDLCGRTRDLRVLLQLTVAEMKLEGTAGLCAGLEVIRGALDRFWESVHPQLDPEDDNDPTERVNIVASLSMAMGTMGDPVRFRKRFQEIALLDGGRLGRITPHDVRVEHDPSQAGGDESTDEIRARIAGISGEVELDVLRAAFESISAAHAAARGIDETLTDKVGAGSAANFEDLLKDLYEAKSAVAQWLESRGASAGEASAEGAEGAEAGAEGAGPGGGAAAPAAPGEIRSPKDVELALQRVRQYYERFEPSSPVPVIISAAEAMISKSFVEIAEAMPPDALGMVVRIRDTAASGGG